MIIDDERYIARHQGKLESLPLLHGIPISIKEQVRNIP